MLENRRKPWFFEQIWGSMCSTFLQKSMIFAYSSKTFKHHCLTQDMQPRALQSEFHKKPTDLSGGHSHVDPPPQSSSPFGTGVHLHLGLAAPPPHQSVSCSKKKQKEVG